MPGTASAKTNQTSPAAAPLPTFSSPMLAATDRLLAQVSQRLAGPEARFSGRSLAFADRILARRGAVFSDGADGAGLDEPGAVGGLSQRLSSLSSPTARSLDPQGWVFSSGWLPSPASLAQARAERGRGAAMPVVTPPAAKTARAATPAVKTAPAAGAPAPVAGAPASVAGAPAPVAGPLAAAASVAVSSPAVENAAPAASRAPSELPLPLAAAVAAAGRPGEIAAPAIPGAPSLPVEAAAPALPAAPSPSPLLEGSVAAPAGSEAAPAGIAPAAVAAPSESRVRDSLALTAPSRRTPAVLPSLARSFGHLAWADVRLGRAPEPIGLADAAAPSPGFALPSGADPALAALRGPSPEAAVRQPAGAPPSLTMVNPVDLVARRPVEARREAVRAGSPVAPAPARRPEAAPAQPAPAVAPASLPFAPEVRPGAAVPQVREAPAAFAAPTAAPASAAGFAPAAPRFDAGLRPGALDPGLFASSSPALGRASRSLSLAELFLEGATAPSALSSSPVAAAARPWQAPGGLASRTERLASTTFAQSASGSVGPSVFGAAPSWQAAPGVPAALRQVLASAEAPSLRRAWSGPLPFLPSPRLETLRPVAASGPVAAAAGAAAPAGVRGAAPTSRAVTAPTPLIAPSMAPSVVAAPSSASVPGLHAPSTASAPWRQPGGAATLAELFAAGIGLGSGAASSAAIRTLAAGPLSLLPPWLAPPPVAEDATPAQAARVPSAALEFVRRERAEQPAVATARSAGSDARAAVRPLSPVRAPQLGLGAPSFQQVGGLAAQTEAFASQRGLPGSPVGVSTAAAPEPGAWRPISGGMVYVPAPSAEPAARAARAGQASSSVARTLPRAAEAAPSLLPGVAPVAGGARPAGAFQSLGGVGLRSELFAADVAPVVAAPQSGAAPAERSTWASAPGVPSAVARALLRAEPAAAATLPRWTLGDAGLMYLSAPQAAATARAGRAAVAPAAAPALAAPAARAAAPSPFTAPSPTGAPAAALESPSAQPASLAGAAVPSAEARAPWQRAGGLATLAELFAAGVGLGSASASGLAQQAGVAASGGLLPAWLGPFAQASGAEPSSAAPSEARERAEARGALPRLLYLGRDERSRTDATVASGERAALPSRRPAPAPLGAAARAAEAASGVSAPAPSAPVAAGFWQQAGGLAARAEAFVHDRSSAGLVDSLATPGTAPVAEQRFLPVAGGLVYLPAARRPLASEAAQTAPAAPGRATAPTAAAAASRWAALPSQPAYARAGGLGLASELFSAGVAPSMLASTGPDGAPASPWAGVSSLPMVSAAAAPRRQAGGSSLSLPMAGTAAPSLGGRAPALAPGAAPSVVPGLARGWQAPGALASLAERFSDATADRGSAGASAEAGVSADAAPANLWPVLSLGADPLTGQRSAGARAGGRSDLERRYSDRMLTSFPRVAAPTADSSAPAAQPAQLLPQTTQRAAQLERLSQLLAMLPTDFRPTAALQQAAESSGVAGLPLWQRMPAPLASASPSVAAQAGPLGRPAPTGLGAPLLGSDPGELDEEGLDPDEAFHTPLGGRPALTLVSSVGYEHRVQRPGADRSAPASGTRQAAPPVSASAPAWQRQAPAATLVTQVMQAAVAGNKPAEASLRLMEAIRSHASGEVARSDDRISLGDLTMIAISMGDRRIAAASQGVSAPSVPHVETALRQYDHPNQPEDNKTRDDKIDRMAKAVKKFMKQDEFRDGMRGAANSSGTS